MQLHLVRGPGVDTSSEAWRISCEARQVLAWPLDKRREYLKSVESHRGKGGADALKAAIQAEWDKRRAA